MLIVLTTTSSEDEASYLARELVDRKLAACVQVLPKMTSVYSWEGKIQSEPEHLLLIKTLEEKFDGVSEFIRKNHSYEVPEILAIDAEHVSSDYLRWVDEAVSDRDGRPVRDD